MKDLMDDGYRDDVLLETADHAGEAPSPLVQVNEDHTVEVISIDKNMDLMGRLAELGIYPGETIRILKNRKKGPILVETKGSTFMLTKNIAERIYVRLK